MTSMPAGHAGRAGGPHRGGRLCQVNVQVQRQRLPRIQRQRLPDQALGLCRGGRQAAVRLHGQPRNSLGHP